MILSQGILDELRHQAELQGKKNYRCIEVDWRTVIALCDETERWRKKIVPVVDHPAVSSDGKFIRGDWVVFCGKEYGFLAYTIDGDCCFLNPLDSEDESRSFCVRAYDVRKAPL